MRSEVRSRMSDCVKVRCATKRDVIGEVSMQAICTSGELGSGRNETSSAEEYAIIHFGRRLDTIETCLLRLLILELLHQLLDIKPTQLRFCHNGPRFARYRCIDHLAI